MTPFYTVVTLLATTYGYGEKMCGDIGKPQTCDSQAITASGTPLDPGSPSVAVFLLPIQRLRRGSFLCIQHLETGEEVWLEVLDKHYKSDRVDLTPAAVEAIGGKAGKTWSAQVQLCGERRNDDDESRNS